MLAKELKLKKTEEHAGNILIRKLVLKRIN
jgi:hypothetical protein